MELAGVPNARHDVHAMSSGGYSMYRITEAARAPCIVSCLAALLLVAAGCAQPETAEDMPATPAPPRQAEVTVSAATVAPGTPVDVSVSGFTPRTTVQVGFGQPASEYTVISQEQVDDSGQLTVSFPVPDWAMRGLPYVVVVTDASDRTVSNPFVVGAAGDSVTVQGMLTDEGVECPALRGPAGELYTLALTDLEYDPGTEVRVEGTIAAVSICMQGTTLNVRSIERR
jgi:hypothetical protein